MSVSDATDEDIEGGASPPHADASGTSDPAGAPRHQVAHFTSDAELLAEIGERLIATPQIALVELIKNAYDASPYACSATS